MARDLFHCHIPQPSQLLHCKIFSFEGVPYALVADNGSHFTAQNVEYGFKLVGYHHLSTPSRYPQSLMAQLRVLCTLKKIMKLITARTFDELDRRFDNFLMEYRNSVHAAAGNSPAKFFKNRVLGNNLLQLQSSEAIIRRGNELRPSKGVVQNQFGKRLCQIPDFTDDSLYHRHIDQIDFNSLSDFQCVYTNLGVSESALDVSDTGK